MTTLRDLAQEALAHCNGDPKAAKNRIREKVCANKKLLDTILEEVIDIAVSAQVDLSRREKNKGRLRTARGRMERVREVSEVIAEVLLNLSLRSGKKLRDAVRGDLKVEVEFFYQQGRTMITKGRFYKTVMTRLPDDETIVGTVLDESDLQSILNESERPLSQVARAEVA